MCLTTPTATFKILAGDTSLPVEVQKLAAAYIQNANIQNAAITEAQDPKNKPSTGHDDFTCTIYSLNNKTFPGLIAKMEERRLAAVEQDIKNGKYYTGAIMNLPGELIQRGPKIIQPTKNVGPNQDGTFPEDKTRERIYENFERVWKFYKKCFGRNSIDGGGLELRATIHVARGYANASWNPAASAMFFGDAGRPDGRGWLIDPEPTLEKGPSKQDSAATEEEEINYQRKHEDWKAAQTELTNWHSLESLDVVGHELTHGVVSYTAQLGKKQRGKNAAAYAEAGTLNEHIADCFGIMIKHFKDQHTAEQGSWDMCPDLWSAAAMRSREPNWTESYMRTFRVPANLATQPDQGPKHTKDMLAFNADTDPHDNVGIPNNAFYRAAMEFCKESKKPTWENVGRIWYNALTDPNFQAPENQTFKGWRDLTIKHAETLFSAKGKAIISRAWQAVGV